MRDDARQCRKAVGLSTTISSADLFNLIATDLEAKVKLLGGLFSRAEDPFHRLELLAEAPGKFRVILLELGEVPAGESRRGCIQEVTYQVTVSHNRGLPFLRGNGLTNPPSPTDKSLMERCRSVRDWLRGTVLPSDGATEGKLGYRGRQPVVYEGAQLDAYEMIFTAFVGLPVPTPRT